MAGEDRCASHQRCRGAGGAKLGNRPDEGDLRQLLACSVNRFIHQTAVPATRSDNQTTRHHHPAHHRQGLRPADVVDRQ
jgi:hypothetical protein